MGTKRSTLQRKADHRIGDRIRRRRRFLGMTQAALASALGVTYQVLQRYESGDYHIGSDRLKEVAFLLGVPLQQLSTGRPPGSAQADALQRFAESYDGIALLRAVSQIEDRKARKRIISAIESLSRGPPEEETGQRQLRAGLIHDCRRMNSPEKDAEAVRAI